MKARRMTSWPGASSPSSVGAVTSAVSSPVIAGASAATAARISASTSRPYPVGSRLIVIDPQKRWLHDGEKPDYAGLLTFAGVPYTEEAAELAGFDVAVVGAPMDDLVSDRPGTRLAPRAIRAASSPPGRTWRSSSTPSWSCGWSTTATRP